MTYAMFECGKKYNQFYVWEIIAVLHSESPHNISFELLILNSFSKQNENKKYQTVYEGTCPCTIALFKKTVKDSHFA